MLGKFFLSLSIRNLGRPIGGQSTCIENNKFILSAHEQQEANNRGRSRRSAAYGLQQEAQPVSGRLFFR